MDSSYTRTGLSVLSNDGSDAVSAYRTSIRNLAAWAETNAALRGQGLLSARPAAGKAGTFYKATDAATGILYYDNGTTWETIGAAPPTDGSAATPSLRTLGSGATQAAAGNHTHAAGVTALYAIKPIGTLKSNDATMADDPHLTLTLAASGVYRITTRIIFIAGSTPKMKMNFAFGSGVTCKAWSMAGPNDSGQYVTGSQRITFADVITTDNGSSSLGEAYGHLVHEIVATTAASGIYTVTFRWAQQTSNASTVTLYEGSHMIAEKIA